MPTSALFSMTCFPVGADAYIGPRSDDLSLVGADAHIGPHSYFWKYSSDDHFCGLSSIYFHLII